jgi:hypothetical protein
MMDWKATVAYLDILSQHLLERLGENAKSFAVTMAGS